MNYQKCFILIFIFLLLSGMVKEMVFSVMADKTNTQNIDEDEEGDELASLEDELHYKAVLPFEQLTPEEFVARHRDEASYQPYLYQRFRDLKLNTWTHRVRDLLHGWLASGDDNFKKDFPYERMSPEEYAVWFKHEIIHFGLHYFTFQDKKFQRWLRQLGRLLSNDDLLEKYEKEHLSPEELALVNKLRRNSVGLETDEETLTPQEPLTPQEQIIFDRVKKLAGRDSR